MKILVVDDHALVREGLCQVLKGLDPAQPTEVLQAPDCAHAFVLAQAHPDLELVLLDYHLPDMNGLAALAILGKTHPELPVVILSGSANPSIMQQALAQGAAGFITKSGLSDELLGALRRVLDGEIYVPTSLAAFPGLETDALSTSRQPPVFSPRQLEVLQLLLDGCTNREIGAQLFVGDETIKTHVTNIMRILNAKTRTQAATEAARWGYRKSSTSSPG
ncbi:MAG: response regulator transcription factor [Rhodoferax sp.]|uniref:response regulator n=1 Tax=Rhodoferax sp. TaxID=50421 RepID=UPI00263515A2|nr:response regulator transcription factor [Rhodoferax sp.]MDD2881725.1 response regulator transcription factor [Rhodoferax sp.]